jgi:ApaG protein
MRKHCFQYTIRITNNSPSDTIQLLSRRFEIQTVGSSMKDVVQGEGVTGRTPILKPSEVFEYTSTAPLSVRPIATTVIAARMMGEYKYVTLSEGQETATEEQIKEGGDASSELGMFHFVFPQEQRVQPVTAAYEEDDDEDDDMKTTTVSSSTSSKTRSAVAPPPSDKLAPQKAAVSPASTLPGDTDMSSGNISVNTSDSSNVSTDNVRVQVSSIYRPERSDSKLDKHCFAYNVRITNESPSQNIQLVSRRFEIQTIGSDTKDVVQGAGVTGRQPILKPDESFEYTSTAPLSVTPMPDKTAVVARMEGEYNFVLLGEDGSSPISSTPLQAKMGVFHFILPDIEAV